MNLAQAIALVFRYGNVAAKSEEELLKHIKDANVKDGELKDAETRCLFAVEQAFYEIRKRLTVERQQREQAMATAAKAGRCEAESGDRWRYHRSAGGQFPEDGAHGLEQCSCIPRCFGSFALQKESHHS